MGSCCSTRDTSVINKPINWRTISPIEQRVTFFSEVQFMKMRIEMIKELSFFMNALHETEEVGYSVLKNKRKDHLAKRYTQFHPSSAVSGDGNGQETVKEGLFEGEEEAEKQRRLDPKNKNKKDKMTSSTLDFVPSAQAEYVAKLSDMKELQTMFSVACALGKLTDARDIFELGIKKLQQRRKQEEHQQGGTTTPRHHVQFDINKPLNCFHRPDFENRETVRWTPLQLAIASFSSTGLFMQDGSTAISSSASSSNSVPRTPPDYIARLNDKIIRAHQEFDVRKRREQEHRIYDYVNAFVEEGLDRFRLNYVPPPIQSSMHRRNKKKEKEKEESDDDDDDDIPSAPSDLKEYDVVKMKFKVPQRIQESNKKRLADFVEFLLSEGADPNGNRKETKGINDEKGARYLQAKEDEDSVGPLLSGPDPEEQVKAAIENGKSILQYDHPLFLAIRGCGAYAQRVPNELVVAELLAQNETIVDPIATHVSSVLDAHTFKTPLFTLCEGMNNGVSSKQDSDNNASHANAALPPRLQAVSLLIARGADKNFVSLIEKGMGFNRFSPLNAAQNCRNQELEKLLEANGCVAQVQPPNRKERRRRGSMELLVAL